MSVVVCICSVYWQMQIIKYTFTLYILGVYYINVLSSNSFQVDTFHFEEKLIKTQDVLTRGEAFFPAEKCLKT